MDKINNFFKKLRFSYKSLPDKKQYIEFFTALLTVPVLLTVIILNLSNLQKKDEPEDKKEQTPIIVTTAPRNEDEDENTVTVTEAPCKEEIGPISIAAPQENEIVEDNPLSIDINYNSRGYCAVVWAYKINNGRLSDYGSNNIVIYNPPTGTIRFELHVRSLVTGEQEVLRRTFTYAGGSAVPTPTDTPQASGSAN